MNFEEMVAYLLYRVARDELPLGAVQKILYDIKELTERGPAIPIYSNKHLEAWAKSEAKNLYKISL